MVAVLGVVGGAVLVEEGAMVVNSLPELQDLLVHRSLVFRFVALAILLVAMMRLVVIGVTFGTILLPCALVCMISWFRVLLSLVVMG
jgi:hypothetical protein